MFRLSNCVKITSTFTSLGDASTLVGMTVREEVILTIILTLSLGTYRPLIFLQTCPLTIVSFSDQCLI